MATNSMCYRNHPEQDDKCCYCRCHINNSTFNLTSLRCAPNSGFRPGMYEVWILGLRCSCQSWLSVDILSASISVLD